MFHKQVARWYRGYFQCIKVRNYNLFKKNPKLGIVAYFYIAANTIGTPLMILAILGLFGNFAAWGALGFILYYAVLVWLPTLVKGMFLKLKFSNILRSIMTMPIVHFLRCIYFLNLLSKN